MSLFSVRLVWTNVIADNGLTTCNTLDQGQPEAGEEGREANETTVAKTELAQIQIMDLTICHCAPISSVSYRPTYFLYSKVLGHYIKQFFPSIYPILPQGFLKTTGKHYPSGLQRR